ncbi:MAG: hypothetical protein AB7O66_06490 [Limisphaerales bacterium]
MNPSTPPRDPNPSSRPKLPAAADAAATVLVTTLAAVVLALTGTFPPPTASAGQPPRTHVRIDSFHLTDQFGAEHRMEFPRSRPLLLLVGDRKGSEEIDPWIEPLKARWGNVCDIVGVADVDGVPRFLRGRITEAIRESRAKPLLLDFEGKVTRRLPCEKKTANVFAIDPTGLMTAHVSGPYPHGTNRLRMLSTLERALAPVSPQQPSPTPSPTPSAPPTAESASP